MNDIFAWFGTHQVYYYLIALTALFFFLTLALWSREPVDAPHLDGVFLAATTLTLFAWRWPVFLAPFPLNPDESTWAAGAIKATVDFAPWRGFSPGTSGPLNAYILALPSLVGAPITFASGRIIATCLMGTALIALYYAVKWTHGARVARLAILPPVVLLSLTTDWDFVHYSSEHLSICLTTIVLAASAHLAKPKGSISSHTIAGAVAGFCVGSTLFAKLQAASIAFVVFIFAATAVFSLWERQGKKVRLVALAMVGALCAVPAVIVVSLCWTGELNDAYLSYVRVNIAYIAGGLKQMRLTFFLECSPSYTAFLTGSLLVILLGAIALVRRRNFSQRSVYVSAASFLLLFTALFVIYMPRREFPHYLLFSIVPLSFCVATALGLTRDAGFWKNRESPIAIVYAALFLLPPLSIAMSSGNPFIRDLSHNLEHPKSMVATAISRYAKPGDPICVWGWASEYYVQTGTYPATRETEVEGFIRGGPYQDHFRQRYLSDLQKGKPVVFVDAVAPGAFGLKDRASQGHESFPAVDAYIRENYELKEQISGARIYVRKIRGIVTADQASGSFNVDARSESGMTIFENDSGGGAVFSFSAEGKWSYASGGPMVGPGGTAAPAPRHFLLPGAHSFGLIVRREDGRFQYLGEGAQLTLKPHEVISLMMNDIVGGAGDNRGSLKISWVRK